METTGSEENRAMGELYIVGTPIGNLGDMTLRALEALKNADTIACEDTRHTLKLLNHFSIAKPLVSCHANDEARASAKIVALLNAGRKVAYCTDAGTPGLSDPGAVLVRQARAAGHTIIPIPGPSALATLVSVSGFGGRGLLFDGFPSPKAARRRARLAVLLEREEAFLLYESPFRIAKLIADIAGLAPARQVCIGRELTKIHEQIVVDSAVALAARFAGGEGLPIPEKGEFAILVAGRSGKSAGNDADGENGSLAKG
jgi:16S rRNA (cytidine1402-2'-O)-methyltransferase